MSDSEINIMALDNVKIVYLMVLVLCNSIFLECGRVKRVVGGMAVECGTAPYVASLRNSSTLQHLCGATILTPHFALTAAHCVTQPPNQYSLQLSNYCDIPPTARVVDVITHYLYDMISRAHDLALLRVELDRNVPAEWEGSLPVSSFGASGVCKIFGYGSREAGSDEPSDELLVADLAIVSLDVCMEALGPIAPAADSGMMCAVGDGTDACQGDSGGPLICDSYIEGICSHGLSCGVRGVPAVYTSVAAHLPWIRAVIGT